MRRYLETHIAEDLARKMVFLGGPRQVGKTTLSKALLSNKQNYLSWDDDAGRSRILGREFPHKGRIVFDELHKYRQWRRYLKGLFDTQHNELNILVTGSARLDLYRRGGDSLQGRYHFWRLYPLSVAELKISSKSDFEHLLCLGGFPEPFLEGSEKQAKRWSREYRTRLVRDELGSLEQFRDLASVELLYDQLPATVGNPLSINSLREQLLISHKTAANWLDALERLYGFFRVAPLGAPKIRAVKKEQKAYLYDWTAVSDAGFRFENLVALHLLKHVHFLQDAEGEDVELRYYRDTTPREVDLVIIKNRKPWLAVECKLTDTAVSPHLRYFKSKFPACRCVQVTMPGQREYVSHEGIEVTSAVTLLRELT
jgi:predicted AAA+ superfamily ATPase